MKRENDDIGRINDEIERIISEGDNNSRETIEDISDTKKIDSIGEVDLEEVGNTKRINSIDEIDYRVIEVDDCVEEESSLENISDKRSSDVTEKIDSDISVKESKPKKKEIIESVKKSV